MTQDIHTAVFDLDGTLIRTEDLKDAFKQIAVDYGCTVDEAEEVYRSSRTCVNKETSKEEMAFSREYFAEKLIAFLKAQKGQNIVEIDFARLDAVLDERLLVDGAIELINGIQKKGLIYYLITLGVESWQMEKIKGALLDEYFSFGDEEREGNILITCNNEREGGRKMVAMREKFGDDFDGSGVVFFNDKPWETKNLALEFRKLTNFVVRDDRDKRYTEDDFKRAKSETIDGGGTFFWSDNLVDLKIEFERLIETERYYDGTRK